ncbi:hypothetical protein [uncultured Oscillibacter sp.]|uniref:hypothetical protein n=1 Tax=uncultured Oscillibacter sp. TaxID=876091 RepID=UPI0025DE06F2|nr:hypothetical protein [uncultured Oscillibacter sp.]
METKVLKVMPHEFEGQDKNVIKGSYVYLLVTRSNGTEETRRIFVSDDRMAEWAHVPKEGDIVYVFAKDGKVIDMLPVAAKSSRGSVAASGGESVPF